MITSNQKSYLVTGGCGFIGSHLVDKLISEGAKVIVLDNLSTGKRSNLSSDAELIVGDIRDQALVNELMSRVDGCFHLAAVVSVELSKQDWSGTHEVNQTGTINIFNAARCGIHNAPIPVIYASSAAVYGDSENLPCSETTMPSPLTAYGADKLACELHAQVAWQVFKVPTMGFRFFNVYGPRQDPQSVYSGVISIFLDKISQSKTITIYGDGEQSRDFVYVEDVISFLIDGMQHLMQMNFVNSVYNVCTGQATSINQLALIISEIIGKHPEIVYAKSRIGDIYRSVGCPLRAIHELKRKASYSLHEGLSKLGLPFQR